jgi:hypothetical protein
MAEQAVETRVVIVSTFLLGAAVWGFAVWGVVDVVRRIFG